MQVLKAVESIGSLVDEMGKTPQYCIKKDVHLIEAFAVNRNSSFEWTRTTHHSTIVLMDVHTDMDLFCASNVILQK